MKNTTTNATEKKNIPTLIPPIGQSKYWTGLAKMIQY